VTARREYVLHCDYGGCKDWVRVVASTVTEARRIARGSGRFTRWTARRVPTFECHVTKDYCPRHKP